MAIVLLDGTIRGGHRELREQLGYDEGELVGAPAATFSESSDADRTERREELIATDPIPRRAAQLRRKDGSLVNVINPAIVVRDHDDRPRYVIARAEASQRSESAQEEP